MSNRGDFVGTAPNSGNYIPAPVPADKEDLPVYVNDELLRLGGTVNGVLEGGALPPHSKLPKRFKEGMIMNFSGDVGGGVDSSGVWLYKGAKWWKLIDDPTTITDEIYERIEEIDQLLIDLNLELDNLNNNTLPELRGELDNLNDNVLPELQGELDDLNDNKLPALQRELDAVETDLGNLNRNVIPNIRGDLTQANRDLSSLEGRFPIAETDIQDNSISTPKLQANSVNADKIVANSITTGKLVALAVTVDKLAANSVNADKIVANSITGDKIRANTINGDRIIANTINGDKIVANTINGNRIIANTFSGDKIVANSINGDKIVANSINGDRILANSIKGNKILANSITGGKISSTSTITAGSGNKSASLNGSDPTWRLYAGSSTPSSAPFRVDKDGNLFATSGTFGGKVFAKELSGEIASGAVIPYEGFSKTHDNNVTTFNQSYTLARFNVAPVISGGTVMPSSISTGNMGSIDWVVNGAGYDRANRYLRVITIILENENTGQKYTKVIHNETFDGQSGFTDSISAVIPTLVLPVASITNTYKVSANIRWELSHGTRNVSKASLVAGNMVVTRIVNTNTIRSR